MLHKLWMGSLIIPLVAAGIFLGADRVSDAEYHAANTSNEVWCTLLVSQKQGQGGPRSVLQLSITHHSHRPLFLPLPENNRLLLDWGILSVSIKDSKGNPYYYVPDPGPFIPPRRDHYVRLTPQTKVTFDVDLCRFRDPNHSTSPCSKPDRYTIRVTYANEKDRYWDTQLANFIRLDGVWKGNTTCGPVAFEVAETVTLEKIFSKLDTIRVLSYQSRIRIEWGSNLEL